MAEIDIREAVRLALRDEMRRDERVVLLGEDLGRLGGVFGVTEGLLEEFGAERVIDTPMAEGGVVGAAIGMAMYGLRPVPEVQLADFLWPAFDQIVSEAAKVRYRSGGQYTCPLVIRAPYGGGVGGGPYHSQSPEAYLAHTPGLVVVAPSTPFDAAGLLRSAVRSDDPVVFLEPKRLYRGFTEEVPEEDFTVPLGAARRVREGDDVTLLAYGAMVHIAAEAAERAAASGIEADLIDLRTLAPLDAESVLSSVARTGKMVIVHEAPKFCGFGAELAAIAAEKAILHLEAPILRVTGFDTPVPYALEAMYLPAADRIVEALVGVANF